MFISSVFSNMLKGANLQVLAEADEHEVVRQVQVIIIIAFQPECDLLGLSELDHTDHTLQEIYASFLAVDPFMFTLDLANNHEFLRWTSRDLHVR